MRARRRFRNSTALVALLHLVLLVPVADALLHAGIDTEVHIEAESRPHCAPDHHHFLCQTWRVLGPRPGITQPPQSPAEPVVPHTAARTDTRGHRDPADLSPGGPRAPPSA